MTAPRRESELFSAAYEGELATNDQAEFERRLSQDPSLRAEYEAFSQLMMRADRAYANAPVPDLMPGIRAKLKQRRGLLRGDRFGQLRGHGRLSPLLLGAVLATLLLLLWLVFSALPVLHPDATPGASPAGQTRPAVH